jgi:hypothetical protein
MRSFIRSKAPAPQCAFIFPPRAQQNPAEPLLVDQDRHCALDVMPSTPAPLSAVPPVIGIRLPSTLARRPPDIHQAEARLDAPTANVGVAIASFYPSISLTGNFGLRAIDASCTKALKCTSPATAREMHDEAESERQYEIGSKRHHVACVPVGPKRMPTA